MIKLNTLKLENFMCVEKADLDFKDQKVIILLGSNGHGKSTVLDAISLCLNETKRGDSYKDYVMRGKDKAHIVLDCELKGIPAVFDIYINTKNPPLERKLIYNNDTQHPYINSDVTKLLATLDMSYYSDIIMSMQGADDITKLSPAQRADYLQKLLNFSFDNEVKFCKERLETLKAQDKHNEEVINISSSQVTTKEGQVTRVPIDDFSDRIKDLSGAVDIINRRLKEYQGLNEEQVNITTRLNEVLRDKYTAESTIKTVQVNLDKLPELKENLDSLSKEKLTLSGSVTVKLNESAQLTKSLTEFSTQQETIDETRSSIITKLANANADLASVRKHIDLIDSGKCPTCGHEFTAADKDEYTKQYDALTTTVEDLQNQLTSIQAELASVREQQVGISTDIGELSTSVNSMNNRIASIDNEANALSQQIAYLEGDAKVILEQNQSKYDSLKAEEDSLGNKQAQLTDSLNEYAKLNKDLQSAQVQINELNKKALMRESIIKNNENIKNDIAQLNEAISKAQKELEDIHRDEAVYKEAQVLLSKNLPDYLIIKACAALEREMNNFIHIVFPDMDIKLFQNKKGIEFFYTTDAQKDYSKDKLSNVKMASGFEKSVLSIAFKVALCKAYNLPFAFFDEIDGQGTDDNASKLFRSLLTNGLFDQVFVISHKASVRDTIKSTADDVRVYYVNHGNFSLEGDY